MKKIIFIIAVFSIIFFLGKNLNPFDNRMFVFHDETQPARIQQFTLNIKNLKIPPRMAPDFSFKLGYPVFNFYAQTPYWITSAINIAGFDEVNSLKLSYLLALIIAFLSAYLLLRCFFSFYSSLAGGMIYVSSLYFAIDILIRGNLAETWFLTIFPLALFSIYKHSKKPSLELFIANTAILAILFTTHNLLSLISIPIVLIFILFVSEKKRNLLSLITSILLNAYFFIPLFSEMYLTYSAEIARIVKYKDHFLCPLQLWQSKEWGFGGSIPGCNDTMPFKLGKPQVVLFIFAIVFFIYKIIRKIINKEYSGINKEKITFGIFFILLTFGSLFLTTFYSKFLWDMFSPLSSIIQFPWRFIAFSLIGITFLITLFLDSLNFKANYRNILILLVAFAVLYTNSKYFIRQPGEKTKFEHQYLSNKYIQEKAAYRVAEYLPKTADYKFWRSIDPEKNKKYIKTFNYKLPLEYITINQLVINDNSEFNKSFFIDSKQEIKLNIHYFPYWKIYIDNVYYEPSSLDKLGRPIILLKKPSNIKIIYRQTLIEKIGNIISIVTLISLLLLLNRKYGKE